MIRQVLSTKAITKDERRSREDSLSPNSGARPRKRAARDSEGERLPLYETIYRILRRHIVEEALPRGLVIGEAAVARAFHSGRIPASAALRRLKEEGLLSDYSGRGLIIGRGKIEPLRLDLIEAGLSLPEQDGLKHGIRNRRVKIYPEVEHIVAYHLSYGRFLLNESALAEHYGVSRTVAHEILAQLDRVSLVTQDSNRRWYVGPLTADQMREHFELRWLLEPVALDQAFPHLQRTDLVAKEERIRSLQKGNRTPAKLERLERDLHIETVLRCSNSRLIDAIKRSQLPLLATHDIFQRHHDVEEVEAMLSEHLSIFRCLLADEPEKARTALERHLKRSVEPNVRQLDALEPLPEARRVPYLIAAD
jgi:DNA-binding GntR family transcriptional regulator